MLKFSFYNSLPFWTAFIVIAVAFRSLFNKSKYSSYFLLLSSVWMILALPQFKLLHFFLLSGLVLMTYFVGQKLNDLNIVTAKGTRRFLAIATILIILLFLAIFKYAKFQALLSPHAFISFIGISYLSFKMIHFIVEASKGKLENLSLLNYFNFVAFFPAFMSGPINRYNHFSRQFTDQTIHSSKRGIKEGLERIIHGLFKKLVLVQILQPHLLSKQVEQLSQLSILNIVIGLYAYAFYFYFDFSGYSDLAIGVARILGFELPENFNNPFLRRNIRELWTNWHISLTSWLVDYIYWPLVRKLRNADYFRSHPVLLSNLCMIVTFIACGIWHGESFNFIIWGAYHGVGISLLTLYQRGKRRIPIRPIQRYFASKSSHALGVVVTFNYFALGLSLFIMDTSALRILLNSLLR